MFLVFYKKDGTKLFEWGNYQCVPRIGETICERIISPDGFSGWEDYFVENIHYYEDGSVDVYVKKTN